jgi:hypothetical protein
MAALAAAAELIEDHALEEQESKKPTAPNSVLCCAISERNGGLCFTSHRIAEDATMVRLPK